MDNLKQVIYALQELEQDSSTPKNVKSKVSSTIKALSDESETGLKISKALQELEYLSEDCNVQSYTRIQIFNIVSLLELV